jgi:hypothetical protein
VTALAGHTVFARLIRLLLCALDEQQRKATADTLETQTPNKKIPFGSITLSWRGNGKFNFNGKKNRKLKDLEFFWNLHTTHIHNKNDKNTVKSPHHQHQTTRATHTTTKNNRLFLF